MASNHYHFITRWRVKGKCAEVYAIISNAKEYPRWWNDVYLRIENLCPGNQDGLHASGTLLTKGFLPYTLRWAYAVTEVKPPCGFCISANGDLEGAGVWTFTQDGDYTDICFDWKVKAEKGLLKYLSWLLRPLFSLNHAWTMRRGEENLLQELRRLQQVAGS